MDKPEDPRDLVHVVHADGRVRQVPRHAASKRGLRLATEDEISALEAPAPIDEMPEVVIEE